jgi:putative transposase
LRGLSDLRSDLRLPFMDSVPCSRKPQLAPTSSVARSACMSMPGVLESATITSEHLMALPPPDPGVPHRKRIRHFNTIGQAHFLTFSCFQRRPFLERDRTRQWLVTAIDAARTSHHFDLWAFVIMPEHAHLIVFPRCETYEVSGMLKSIKQSVAKRAVRFVKASAPAFLDQMMDVQPNGTSVFRFWQRGPGYDRNLRTTEEVWEKINYVHGNAVKRGLCARSEDWGWSSAADYAGVRAGPLTLDLECLPRNM